MTKYFAAFAMFAGLQSILSGQSNNSEAVHARTEFRFEVDLPYAEAFPLFGACTEQKWAPDWKPQFLYPNPPVDREGAVFLVHRDPSHSSVWISTRFDVASGQVQYVYILNRALVTKIDIQVTKLSEDRTSVAVAYERTALDPSAAEHVRAMAKQDESAGPEWQSAISVYAANKHKTGLKHH